MFEGGKGARQGKYFDGGWCGVGGTPLHPVCILFRLLLAPSSCWLVCCLWHSNDFLLLSLKWPIVQLATYCVYPNIASPLVPHTHTPTACGIHQSTCETCSISYFRSPRCFNNDNIANYTLWLGAHLISHQRLRFNAGHAYQHGCSEFNDSTAQPWLHFYYILVKFEYN